MHCGGLGKCKLDEHPFVFRHDPKPSFFFGWHIGTPSFFSTTSSSSNLSFFFKKDAFFYQCSVPVCFRFRLWFPSPSLKWTCSEPSESVARTIENKADTRRQKKGRKIVPTTHGLVQRKREPRQYSYDGINNDCKRSGSYAIRGGVV